ncbi:MAG: flippase-like domain-containing protein [Candidatus Thorarchaeota archaeon]|nr:flippase-like domain-containing protein [Candidatus Thorarchaeota archaeon]
MSDTNPCEIPVERSGLVSVRKLLLFVFAGVVIYLLMILYGEIGRIASALSVIPWWWVVPAILVLSFLNYIIRYVKWQYFLRRIDVNLRHLESFSVFLAGFTLTVSPGKIGEVIKGYFCNQLKGTPIAKVVPVVVSERVTDLLAMVLLAMMGFLLGFNTGNELITIIGLGGLVFFGALVLSRRSLYNRLIKRMTSFGPLKRFQSSCDMIEDTMVRTLAPRPMLVSTTISVPGWFMECIELWILLGLLTGTGLPSLAPESLLLLVHATFIHSAASVIGALVFTPGGLIGYEASSIALMQVLLGLTEAVASVATILIRLATLWFSVVVGFVALAAVERLHRQGELLSVQQA